MNTKPIPVRGSGSPQASRLISARAGKTSGAAPRNHRGTAHPGVCGENSTIVGMASAKPGSSPRVRRKRPGGVVGVQHPGLIPACAGKTGRRGRASPHSGDHPRACGENPARTPPPRSWSGSSPRVRGKLHQDPGGAQSGGLIPARAGKTVRVLAVRGAAEAHPRACGENVDPRRVDPALAAHPRACGENEAQIQDSLVEFGSSPRVRGKPAARLGVDGLLGLIPARAGKTMVCPPCWRRTAAHPRACGENDATQEVPRVHSGSSPRVRGKREGLGHLAPPRRLIPARAGKTNPPASRGRSSAAHPRACGENPGR